MKKEKLNLEKQEQMTSDWGFIYCDEGEYADMSLDLYDYQETTSPIPDVSFGFFDGSYDKLRKIVATVIPDWVQFFEDDTPVFCGFIDRKPVSFCIIENEDDYIISVPGVSVGSIGCVGTLPKYRRRGIGLRMVDLATVILKERGYDKSYIHYTAIDKWYAKLGYETFIRFSIEERPRCLWPGMNEKMLLYHDKEWGVPVYDDKKMFEHLMMEVMQCGLSWNLMIQKREIFRECFAQFDFDKVAAFDDDDIERILNTPGMIRSRRKVEAVIQNARCFQDIRREFGSFTDYIWGYTDGKTYLYAGHEKGQVPAKNGLSERISKDLRKRGMKYMGGITVYSHLQSCGIINDHCETCFRYRQLLDITDTVKKRRDKEG